MRVSIYELLPRLRIIGIGWEQCCSEVSSLPLPTRWKSATQQFAFSGKADSARTLGDYFRLDERNPLSIFSMILKLTVLLILSRGGNPSLEEATWRAMIGPGMTPPSSMCSPSNCGSVAMSTSMIHHFSILKCHHLCESNGKLGGKLSTN